MTGTSFSILQFIFAYIFFLRVVHTALFQVSGVFQLAIFKKKNNFMQSLNEWWGKRDVYARESRVGLRGMIDMV